MWLWLNNTVEPHYKNCLGPKDFVRYNGVRYNVVPSFGTDRFVRYNGVPLYCESYANCENKEIRIYSFHKTINLLRTLKTLNAWNVIFLSCYSSCAGLKNFYIFRPMLYFCLSSPKVFLIFHLSSYHCGSVPFTSAMCMKPLELKNSVCCLFSCLTIFHSLPVHRVRFPFRGMNANYHHYYYYYIGLIPKRHEGLSSHNTRLSLASSAIVRQHAVTGITVRKNAQ